MDAWDSWYYRLCVKYNWYRYEQWRGLIISPKQACLA